MYGLRLRIEYKDINDILTRINIYQDGYSGVADVRFAHAGVSIAWGDQGGEGMPVVYGSSATIYIDAEYDYEFLYLFSADSRKHRVDIEKAGSLIWTGYVEPDSWSEPLIATPYPVQVTAYDGLGFLKDTPYVPSGRKTLEAILQEILAVTGLPLATNTDIDWFEEFSGPGILAAHSIDTVVFNDMSCYEVLEQLFQGCRIFQRAGQWWVISNTKLSKTAATVSGFWFEGEASLQILPAIKQLVVVQDFGYNENLVQNGSFEKYNAELANFENWQNMAVTPEQRNLNDKNEKFVFIPGKQYFPKMETRGYTEIRQGIKKQMPVVQSDSILNISLKYALMGRTGYSAAMFIKIRVVGETETYYIRRNSLVAQKQEFTWHLDDGTIPMSFDHETNAYICLKSHLEKSRTYSIPVDGESVPAYYNTYDQIPAYPYNEVQDHFEDFKATVPCIPVSGILEIYLYVPYHNITEISGSCFTGITLELLDESSNEYPTEKTITVVNNVRNNFAPEELSLVVGDYPVVKNNKIIYKGGFRRADDQPTTGWGIVSEFSIYSYAEFIGRMMVASQRTPRQSYQARLADLIPTVNLIIEDANNPGKRFLESGITYDDRFRAVDGQFTELLAIDLATLTVETTTEFQTAPSTGTGTGSPTATPTNTEERVTMIDQAGAKTSTPSYIYDKYFELKTLPVDDGFGRIQPRRETLDPYALSFDSGTPQFSLKQALVSTNVDSVANQIKINAGSFLSHQYYAQDRDAIASLTLALLPYDPTRQWAIPETSITLPDADGVNLYLKVAKLEGSTASEIITSKDHIEVKAEDDYLTYKLGYIHPVFNGKREASMLWGNVATVADKTFHYEQLVPARVWQLDHNLNKTPSVTIRDFNNLEYECEVFHYDKNITVLTFSAPFAGYADLN